ncbi:hypothetical protein ACFWJ4_13465 [Kitasatospora sp. NPDC127067]|uniref:hypothetical protein n=1 Tax=Kitasatospora sp. NPDC127067 TaxID=3347126 RepID=UPI00366011C0
MGGVEGDGGSPADVVELALHTDTPERFDYAVEALAGGIEVAPAGTAFTPNPIVLDRIA